MPVSKKKTKNAAIDAKLAELPSISKELSINSSPLLTGDAENAATVAFF